MSTNILITTSKITFMYNLYQNLKLVLAYNNFSYQPLVPSAWRCNPHYTQTKFKKGSKDCPFFIYPKIISDEYNDECMMKIIS